MLAKIPVDGKIVKDYYIGNTHIMISDAAYINNSEQDNQRVLEDYKRASLKIYFENKGT